MKKLGLTLAAAASLCMAACGSTIPDMTEEQNALIVEYAAGLLLKYDENYHGRLVETPEPSEEELVKLEQQEGKTQSEEEESQLQEESAQTTPVVDISEEPEVIEYRSIEEFYGISGVTISYIGYELKDMYPDAGADDLFFAMSASNGSKLVVLNFDVVNVSGQDMNLDMLSLGMKFKVSINGEAPRYALTTMLTNDLASYSGTIAAGASEQLVLVVEVPQEKAQSIQTLSLVMKNVAEDATILLN